jgi:hypothetical protein
MFCIGSNPTTSPMSIEVFNELGLDYINERCNTLMSIINNDKFEIRNIMEQLHLERIINMRL